MLNLENQYLLCRVLPDLGGRLYSCRDKRNGREMFYANPVIKKVPFGLRGAWVALGIESNFPATHSRQTTSPVDFALHTEADGSARAILEDIDRVTGMQWRIEYVLRPNSTVLEQRVTLYNRSHARRPYLWWANAGFALDDPGTRFVLPARLVADHGVARMDTWPVNSAGIDESVVANHKGAMSWFAYGCREPFFAVYKPGFRSGFAHFADPDAVAGKKLWLWGSDQEATIRGQVTDNFPIYGELQGGLFENQETYAFLEPEQSRVFSEYWIPIHDLGGVSRVTRDAIVNLERRAGTADRPRLVLEVSVTRPVSNAAIRLVSAGKVAFETHANLDPAARYEHVLQDPGPSPYTFRLSDAQGATLLEHTEGRYAILTPENYQRTKEPPAAASAGESERTKGPASLPGGGESERTKGPASLPGGGESGRTKGRLRCQAAAKAGAERAGFAARRRRKRSDPGREGKERRTGAALECRLDRLHHRLGALSVKYSASQRDGDAGACLESFSGRCRPAAACLRCSRHR